MSVWLGSAHQSSAHKRTGANSGPRQPNTLSCVVQPNCVTLAVASAGNMAGNTDQQDGRFAWQSDVFAGSAARTALLHTVGAKSNRCPCQVSRNVVASAIVTMVRPVCPMRRTVPKGAMRPGCRPERFGFLVRSPTRESNPQSPRRRLDGKVGRTLPLPPMLPLTVLG